MLTINYNIFKLEIFIYALQKIKNYFDIYYEIIYLKILI